MNIAILGTRGIPNNYGGFEQFAEYLSVGLVSKGHTVTVYNSHNHPYQEKEWQGVQISHQFDPEFKIGTAGQFIYDLNCIVHSRNQHFDIILQLGYTSSSIWSKFFPRQSLIITNMDGLEWKRTKYNALAQRFLKLAEKLAVRKSHYLVADSKGIQKYLQATYQAPSTYIPYGATLYHKGPTDALAEVGVEPFGYNLLIARLEPENSIEIILEGLSSSTTEKPFLVIGGLNTRLGSTLPQLYPDARIKFLGPVYDLEKLNCLRVYSNLYFHGHTVGGTNPSLLEAMASDSFICAHGNDFNKAILEKDALYFTNAAEVTALLNTKTKEKDGQEFIINNRNKIQSLFTWDKIITQYEELFALALAEMK